MRVRSASELGQVVRERRRERKLSQAALAEAAGVTRQWLVRFEQGRSDVTLGNVLAVLRALDLDLALDSRSSAPADEHATVRAPRIRIPRPEPEAGERLERARSRVHELDDSDYDTVRRSLEATPR